MKVQITAEEVAALRKEAMGGDAEAHCFLDLARTIGNGVIEDEVKAVRSFRTPFAKGQINALCLNAHFQCDLFVRDGRAARDCDADVRAQRIIDPGKSIAGVPRGRRRATSRGSGRGGRERYV
jgi:hypothetical protein